MAILGRSRPIPAHLAKPIVAPGGAVRIPAIYQARIVSQADQRSIRRPAPPKPHLASPIVSPQALVYPLIHITSKQQSIKRPYVGRTVPKPHLAPGLVTQISVFIAHSPFIVNQGKTRPNTYSRLPRHLLPTAINLPQPLVYPITHTVFTGQAVQRAVRRPPPPKPHLPQAVVAPNPLVYPLVKAVVILQAVKRAMLPRRNPSPHLAPATLTSPNRFLATPIKVISQALQRALTRRSGPKAHLATNVVSHLQPVPPAIIKLQSTQRTRIGRLKPVVRYAPANLAHKPFPPAVVISQTKRRPYIGRTTPKPHLAFGPQDQSPQDPLIQKATSLGQALRRVFIGRWWPKPHLAPANLTPAPPLFLTCLMLGVETTTQTGLTVETTTQTRVNVSGATLTNLSIEGC